MEDQDFGAKVDNQTYRHLVDSIPDYLLVHRNGKILFVNKAVHSRLGYGDEELIGKSVFTFIPSDSHKRRVMENMDARAAGHDVGDYEVDIVDKRGRLHTVIVRAVKTIFNGQPAFQVVLVDITERKTMEEELLRARKLESIGLLAGGIAHDFNNILTGIIAGVSMAKRMVEPGTEVSGLLGDAEEASFRASELTRQLLTFSKGGTPVRTRAYLNQLIRDTVRFALRGSRADCTLDIADTLLPAEIDQGQIGQVLSNLAINADQAMPGGGKLRLRAENVRIGDVEVPSGVKVIDTRENLPLERGLYVRIAVTDSGVGIPAEDLHKVFDPYFTTKNDGTGLGLATVHSIVQKHGGHLAVESGENRGTTFSVYLPAVPDRHSDTREPSRPGRVEGRRILVMDDDATIRTMLEKLLSDVGYRITTVDDGAKALCAYGEALNAADRFAIVLMDLTIPGGMGGKEAARGILAIDPNAKMVVFSGYSNDTVLANFRDYGFAGVVKKPFDVARLIELLDQIVTTEEGGGTK